MPKKKTKQKTQDKIYVSVYLDAADLELLQTERESKEEEYGYKLSNAQILRGLIRTHLGG